MSDLEVALQRRHQRILRLAIWAKRNQVFDLEQLTDKTLELFACSCDTAKGIAKVTLARLKKVRQ